MKLSRRGFLRVAGVTGTAALGVGASRARAATAPDAKGENESAMLVDTTLCVGCRGCEAACAEANELAPPSSDEALLKTRRDTAPEQFTVVNGFGTIGRDNAERFAKKQCMHCIEPACASACPVRALDKTPAGPVIYRGERCMGCRYCMVACPFEIPKYQYDKAVPLVRKCTFCAKRQANGQKPACAEVCPIGCARLRQARRAARAGQDPHLPRARRSTTTTSTASTKPAARSWLYISDVPFEQLGMKKVRDEPYPDKVQGALGAPPFVMTLWPPLLMGLYAFSRRSRENGKKQAEAEGGGRPLQR